MNLLKTSSPLGQSISLGALLAVMSAAVIALVATIGL